MSFVDQLAAALPEHAYINHHPFGVRVARWTTPEALWGFTFKALSSSLEIDGPGVSVTLTKPDIDDALTILHLFGAIEPEPESDDHITLTELSDESVRAARMPEDLLSQAWGLIIGARGPLPGGAPDPWWDAQHRWQDQYHAWLDSQRAEVRTQLLDEIRAGHVPLEPAVEREGAATTACCNGTGHADYAAVPCPAPGCKATERVHGIGHES